MLPVAVMLAGAGILARGTVRRRRHGDHCKGATAVQMRAAATIDRPPPPAELDEGDGEEEYEVRYLTNEERAFNANMWLPLASDADTKLIEERILPFRSTKMYAGKSRLCVGCFLNDRCVGMATAEVVPDLSDLYAFFLQTRLLRALSVVTKPRAGTEIGSLLVGALKQIADEQSFRTDFDPLKDIAGGRYYVYARSL